MRRILLPVLPLVLALLSCESGPQSGRDTISLVKVIASETGNPEHLLLTSYHKVPSSGDIYIIGTPGSCDMICRDFLSCDVYENARGREQRDGLKDFAGETFACVRDSEHAPYDTLLAHEGEEALRELAVRYALSALSPKCSVSIYDLDGNHEKNPAKMIVLADPWLLEKGKFDIDTLFTLTGCKVPVLSPQELLLNAALGGEKKYFNCGILCDSLYLSGGVYPSLFEQEARSRDIVGAHCFTAATPASGCILCAFLDSYLDAGNTAPLDILLIDDWSVDPEIVQKEVEAIKDFSREEYLRYGKLLSDDFAVLHSSAITMSACYSLLREHSLFTHRIAQPGSVDYVVKPYPEASDMQFLLIPSENVQD